MCVMIKKNNCVTLEYIMSRCVVKACYPEAEQYHWMAISIQRN